MKNSSRKPKYILENDPTWLDKNMRWIMLSIAVILLALALFGCESKSGKRIEQQKVESALNLQDSVAHFQTHLRTYKTPTTYYLRAVRGKYMVTFSDDVNAYKINEKVFMVNVHDRRDTTSNSYLVKYDSEMERDRNSYQTEDDELTVAYTLYTVEFKEIDKTKRKSKR